MAEKKLVVFGGSVGGLTAMRKILADLKPQSNRSILLVLHTALDSPRLLPDLLTGVGPLAAAYAENGELIESGRVYIAPPDHHLIVEDGHLLTTRGPKENRFRPAIDPLFRSAALAYGPDAIGVILSGGLDDGVAGLSAIKQAGGLAIVQAPAEAEVPDLPRNTLRQLSVDHCLTTAEIADFLNLPVQDRGEIALSPLSRKRLEIEHSFAKQQNGSVEQIEKVGSPSLLTCPNCQGVLVQLDDDEMLRFRCHTGHAFTAASLLSALKERTEEVLWNSVRILEENSVVLNHMADHLTVDAGTETAVELHQGAQEALDQARAVRSLINGGKLSTADQPR